MIINIYAKLVTLAHRILYYNIEFSALALMDLSVPLCRSIITSIAEMWQWGRYIIPHKHISSLIPVLNFFLYASLRPIAN